MWKNLSLRLRLLIPIRSIFVAAVLLGGLSVVFFASGQLEEENAPASRSAGAVAQALNGALKTASNPQQTLDAFATSLGTSEGIRFRRTGAGATPAQAEVQTPLGLVPHWFVELLGLPEIGASFPVSIAGKQVGEIVFAPDLSSEIYAKWLGFLGLVSSGIFLMVLIGIIAHTTVGTVVKALRDLGEGLTRMRMGDYQQPIAPSGPPEIRQSSEEANALARTLDQLSHDNRNLLRRIVSLQDDERRDMSRELHDELGPLLFGIRANAVALLDDTPHDKEEFETSVRSLLKSIETLQQASRRILDRLRPLFIEEFGLERSIQRVLQNAGAQAPHLKITSRIDPGLAGLDSLLSQTIYRVIQEAVTNILRHANAGSMRVEVAAEGAQFAVEISDDGVGFAPAQTYGRGLTGMKERVRALSGTFEFQRERGRTYVRCRLPAGA